MKYFTLARYVIIATAFFTNGFFTYSNQSKTLIDLDMASDTMEKAEHHTYKKEFKFGASPFKIDDLAYILPMGCMIGGHVTPIDHGYFFGNDRLNATPDQFEIYSPAQGVIIELSRTNRNGSPPFIDHAITMEFPDGLSVHYSNMSSFSPHVLEQSGPVEVNINKGVSIPVEEGELVGRTGQYGIDFSVRDANLKLKGFVVPKHYKGESWKIHTTDMFKHFKKSIRNKLLEKALRPVKPRGGKIDYDIDGRLVGNWFIPGTGGYSGFSHGSEGYWKTHLAIAYDAIDPSAIIVSIGDWQGEAKQFGVQGNNPDPKDISIDSGLVKYELIQFSWMSANGDPWDHDSYVPDLVFKPFENIQGVVLLQMIDKRMLRMEIFPGKTADEVTDFTDNARIYKR